ncbi:hypothetical protein CP532_3323, partial [Ophiocordyceps camponoti-leonardi (nom. inval.)]
MNPKLLFFLAPASLVAGVSDVQRPPLSQDTLALAENICAALRSVDDPGYYSTRSSLPRSLIFDEMVHLAQIACAQLSSKNVAPTSPGRLNKALERTTLYADLPQSPPRDPKLPKRVSCIELINHGAAGELMKVSSPVYGVETELPVTGRIHVVPRLNGTCSCDERQWTPVADRIVILEHREECDAAERVKCAKDHKAQAVLFYSLPTQKSLLDADQQQSLAVEDRDNLLPVGVISVEDARKLADQERRLMRFSAIRLTVETVDDH